MRLIDAEKLIQKISKMLDYCKDNNLEAEMSALFQVGDAVIDCPTVDAVPVLRCVECKHYRNHPNGLCYLHTEPYANERGYKGEAVCVDPDDFCSCGERKE